MLSHFMQKPSSSTLLISVAIVALGLQLSGCASDSYASKGAKQGAVQGAAAGAVGGLVSALVFGGDPLDRAARGAVYGGAAGAVAGGISGSRVDKQVQAQQQAQTHTNARAQSQAQQDAELEALKKEIGRPAFNGLAALAECRHEVTLEKARKAQKSKNPNHRLAGLWLEVLNYADLQQQEQLSRLLPDIVAEDWDIQNEAQAEQVARESAAELITIRKEYNLPLVCNA
ncbi:MAG: hypothetical protein KJN61_07550 [Gammaproteobacteria bacterium]|nr:hypothetical protein [Gammaproteobacteria bacterium]NNK98540.1 hypothetical protein [Xanthomonadales bacterium]